MSEQQSYMEELISDIITNIKEDRAKCARLLMPIIQEIENSHQAGGNIALNVVQNGLGNMAVKFIETMLKANDQLIKTSKILQGHVPEEDDFTLDPDGLNDLYDQLEGND